MKPNLKLCSGVGSRIEGQEDFDVLIWGSDLDSYRTFSLQIIVGGNYPQSHLKHHRWVFCYPPRLRVLFTLLFLDLMNLGVCFPSVFLPGVAGWFCPSSAVMKVCPRVSGFQFFLRKALFPNQSTNTSFWINSEYYEYNEEISRRSGSSFYHHIRWVPYVG